jgi:hypothetical protein
MWWLIRIFIVSIVIIVTMHYGLDYLKNTYSTPKTKDLVSFQTNKYKAIAQEILEQQCEKPPLLIENPGPDLLNGPDFLNTEDKQNLENDLANFLSTQLFTASP